ncbi:hypothetical protein Tco_0755071, partial [Tanacetum coccineum]
MINQCLTGKTSGFDRPRYPVLQMLWGIITSTNVDYAELMWEEFVQAIQTFFVDKANMSIAPQKGKKTKPHVIPYCQFTKLIICHLGRTHNIHQRSASLFHLAEEDHRLGNLKFVPKGEDDEVFGMQIPKELITNNIRNAPYYNAYMEMVAKHDLKIMAERRNLQLLSNSSRSLLKRSQANQHLHQNLRPQHVTHVCSISSKPTTRVCFTGGDIPTCRGRPSQRKKIRKGKSPLQLIDEDEPTQPKPEPEHQGEGEGEEYDVERAIQMSLESFQAK